MKSLASFLVVMALVLSDKEPANPSVSISNPITADCIEEALSLPSGSLDGITVASLPQSESGRLICEGIEVEVFDYITREELDWLVFEAFFGGTATFSILPDAKADSQEYVLTLNDDKSVESVVIRSDMFAWRQVENEYFSEADMGF